MKKNRWFWLVAIIGLGLDQLTKYLIVQGFEYLWVQQNFENLGNPISIWPGIFQISYVINRGAAFGSFQGGAGWLRWLSLIVSLVLIWVGWYAPRLKIMEQLGYGFILAGALGNGIDRFLFGYVVDFLDFPFVKIPIIYFENSWSIGLIKFPVFNFADVFINIGILCLLITNFPVKSESTQNSYNEK